VQLGRELQVGVEVINLSVSYQDNGRAHTAQLPGFPDLGQVTYTGCRGSP
jgi:hypothetical protein